jgi:aminoglycoside phosphotransferase
MSTPADPGRSLPTEAVFAVLDGLADGARLVAGSVRRGVHHLRLVEPDRGSVRAHVWAAQPGRGPGEGADVLGDEAARLGWLAGRLPVPDVQALTRVTVEGVDWTVLACSTVTGQRADDPAAHRDADSAITTVAAALRAVHGLPVADCPFTAATDERLARCRRRVELGLVDPAELAPAYRAHAPARLLGWLEDALSSLDDPSDDDVVVTHGTPILANLLVEGGAPSGYLGWAGAGVGDRYADLAVVAASLATHVSTEALGPFFAAYGLELPSLARIDAFAFLAQLS